MNKKLPRVCQGLSVERALKQALELLKLVPEDVPAIEDRREHSISDIELLLRSEFVE